MYLPSNQSTPEALTAQACLIDFNQDAIFLSVLYSIFFVFGIPLNILALYGLYNLIRCENILPVFVINLLLSNLLQLATLPLWIDYYRTGHCWSFGPIGCHGVTLIFYISIYVAIFFKCLIALERHLAIAWPHKFQAVQKLRSVVCLSVGVWLTVAVPPLVSINTMFHELQNKHLCNEKYPADMHAIIYRLITLALTFVLPFSFISILHMQTLKCLAGLPSSRAEEKRRIRAFLSFLVIIFVVVLGPYHLIGSIKYIGLVFNPGNCEWEKSVFLPYQVGRALLSLNTLLDPIMYIFLRNDFRELAQTHLSCLRRS
ncbi:G-protein coupled receptor 4 [Brienomyrus brachyistius]|uniref:G-protein coupled receptor 4 n=1 Tax=Brienomyrus brachyistius TaxID=42636 RepID=UPI0020B30234|nr:G-protein coupled receptor 4 [Brienomyrus brachyistius]